MSDDQKVKWVLIDGYKPAYNKAVNNFLASLDLGISGAYVPDRYVIRLTLSSDLTPEKQDRLLEALEEFHENEGWVEVKITIH